MVEFGGDKLGAKRGRPVSDESRKGQYRLRMNDEESDMLDDLSAKTGKDKADVIREALRIYSNLVKYQQ